MRLRQLRVCATSAFWAALSIAAASDLDALVAERMAVERVYYDHRTGAKPPLEQALPRELVAKLVREDLHKEAVLREVYGVEITPAMIVTEVERINQTTRAPEVLAEIRQALGNDPERFARAVARPIVVERELRKRFEDDEKLHARQRQLAEEARARFLTNKPVDNAKTVTWLVTPRSCDDRADSLSQDKAAYFAEVDPELRNVLEAQLRKRGAVSAVIETPSDFLVFRLRERNAKKLVVDSVAVRKRSYEEWLAHTATSEPPRDAADR